MQLKRSRVSPRVLDEMARKVNDQQARDDVLADRPRLAAARTVAIYALAGAWALLLAAAPLAALLLLFRVNYTVQWLAAGLGLLTISLALVGLYVIAVWALGARRGQPRGKGFALAGAGLLTVALAAGLIFISQSSDALFWLSSVAVILVSLFVIGTEIFTSATHANRPIFLRLASLAGVLCFGVVLIIAVVSLARLFLAEDVFAEGLLVRSLYVFLMPLGSLLLAISGGSWSQGGRKRG